MRAILIFAIALACGCSDPTATYRITSISMTGPRGERSITLAVGAQVPLTIHARTEGGLEVAPSTSYLVVARQPQVAQVDTAGVITGISAGTTVIVASLDDSGRTLTDSLPVTVTAPPAQARPQSVRSVSRPRVPQR